MSGFNLRMEELRTGCEEMTIAKTAEGKKVIKMSQYQLETAHHIHLDGISYPPHKRVAMAQSVDALTQLIMLNRSKNTPAYQDRWVRAAMKSVSHIPKHQQLIEKLKSCSSSEAASLISLMADILLVTGSRAGNKAFFPYPFLRTCISQECLTDMAKGPDSNMDGQASTYSAVIVTGIEQTDHSGRGAFSLYVSNSKTKFSMYINASERQLKEIIFHCIWGSHWEDLSILNFMTGHDFLTRRQLGNIFQGKGQCNAKIACTPIPTLHYAKLSQALPTDFTAGGQQQVLNKVTFSGKRKAPITEEFFAHCKKVFQVQSEAQGAVNLLNILSQYRHYVLTRANKEQGINQGTVSWRSVQGLTSTFHGA